MTAVWDLELDRKSLGQPPNVLVPTPIPVVGEIGAIHQSDIGAAGEGDFDDLTAFPLSQIVVDEIHGLVLLPTHNVQLRHAASPHRLRLIVGHSPAAPLFPVLRPGLTVVPFSHVAMPHLQPSRGQMQGTRNWL